VSAARDPYVKVYYRIADDPRFVTVFEDDGALSWWLRLLLIADGTWPASAHVPASCKPKALSMLVEAGLIELTGNQRFRVHGMDAEREKRSEHASQASRTRWESNPPSNASGNAPSTAQNMPLNSAQLSSTQTNSSQRNSPPAGVAKNGSKNETDEERLARYLLLRDDPSKSADIRYAAKNEVERLVALRQN
jgi:hypothetical protein